MKDNDTPLFPTVRPDPTEPATKNPSTPTDTQVAAAERIRPRSGTARERVLELLKHEWAYFQNGATDEEMCGCLNMNPNTQRPRRKELEEQGWIRDSGKRRKTKSGCDAIVWVVIP